MNLANSNLSFLNLTFQIKVEHGFFFFLHLVQECCSVSFLCTEVIDKSFLIYAQYLCLANKQEHDFMGAYKPLLVSPLKHGFGQEKCLHPEERSLISCSLLFLCPLMHTPLYISKAALQSQNPFMKGLQRSRGMGKWSWTVSWTCRLTTDNSE